MGGIAQLYLIATVRMEIILENLELSVYFLKRLCKTQIVINLCLGWIDYVMPRPSHSLHINIVLSCIVFVVQGSYLLSAN